MSYIGVSHQFGGLVAKRVAVSADPFEPRVNPLCFGVGLTQLRYLVAIAERGSVTAAARHLGVSQPALSRAIAVLQSNLKVALLARRGRSLALTAAGEATLEPARRALRAVDDLIHVSRQALRRRRVRIATGSAMSPLLGPGMKAIFDGDNSFDLQFVRADTAEDILSLLEAGEADLGFGERPGKRKDIVWRSFERIEAVLASPSDVLLPDEVDTQDLLGIRLLVPPITLGRPRLLDSMLLQAGVRHDQVIEVPEMASLHALAAAGVGSMVGWRFMLEHVPDLILRSFKQRIIRHIGFSFRLGGNPDAKIFIKIMQLASRRDVDYLSAALIPSRRKPPLT